MSWLERKVASSLIAAPPEGTFDGALAHFVKAEELSPKEWKENRLFIAKCHAQLGQMPDCLEWLDKAALAPCISPEVWTCVIGGNFILKFGFLIAICKSQSHHVLYYFCHCCLSRALNIFIFLQRPVSMHCCRTQMQRKKSGSFLSSTRTTDRDNCDIPSHHPSYEPMCVTAPHRQMSYVLSDMWIPYSFYILIFFSTCVYIMLYNFHRTFPKFDKRKKLFHSFVMEKNG